MRQYARTGGRRGTVRLLPASNVPSTGRHGLRLFWIGLLGAALVSIAGCTSSPAGGALPSNSIRPMTSEEGVAACQGSDLDVSVDSADLSIRVKNASSEDCSLTGSPPASMKLGRVDWAEPRADNRRGPSGACLRSATGTGRGRDRLPNSMAKWRSTHRALDGPSPGRHLPPARSRTVNGQRRELLRIHASAGLSRSLVAYPERTDVPDRWFWRTLSVCS